MRFLTTLPSCIRLLCCQHHQCQPLCFVQCGRILRLLLLSVSPRFNMTEKNRQRVQTQKSPTRAAILIPGTGSTSIDRGETLKLTLSSQGFAVREVDVVGKHDAPLQQLLSKTDTVFDIGGHTGPSLLAACEESKVAGLYVFQQSTGMFRKVGGMYLGMNVFLGSGTLNNSSIVQGLSLRQGRVWHVWCCVPPGRCGPRITCSQGPFCRKAAKSRNARPT